MSSFGHAVEVINLITPPSSSHPHHHHAHVTPLTGPPTASTRAAAPGSSLRRPGQHSTWAQALFTPRLLFRGAAQRGQDSVRQPGPAPDLAHTAAARTPAAGRPRRAPAAAAGQPAHAPATEGEPRSPPCPEGRFHLTTRAGERMWVGQVKQQQQHGGAGLPPPLWPRRKSRRAGWDPALVASCRAHEHAISSLEGLQASREFQQHVR